MELGVSAIVCCHNAEKRIADVLDHLANQQFNNTKIPWEVLIIDNASTDKTSEVAKKCWRGDADKLHVFYEPTPGLSYARVCGIKNSKFEYLTFIDDDNWVMNNWIEKVYEILSSNKNVALCGGLGEPVFDGEIPDWFEEFHQAFAVGPQAEKKGIVTYKDRNYLHGAGVSIKKSIYYELFSRGFSYKLSGRKGKRLNSGEDSELSMAVKIIGYDLYYDPDLKFKHVLGSGRMTFDYLKRLYSAFGRSSVVLQIYNSLLDSSTPLKQFVLKNSFPSIVYSLRNIAKHLIRFVISVMLNKKKDRKDALQLYYLWNNLKEKIILMPKYNSIVKSIYNLKKDRV